MSDACRPRRVGKGGSIPPNLAGAQEAEKGVSGPLNSAGAHKGEEGGRRPPNSAGARTRSRERWE
eukprot:scaffold206692_cov14-Tisochrysis_lutea.AAC.1